MKLRDILNGYSEDSILKRIKPDVSPAYKLPIWFGPMGDLKRDDLDQEFKDVELVDRERSVEILTSVDETVVFEIQENSKSVIRFNV